MNSTIQGTKLNIVAQQEKLVRTFATLDGDRQEVIAYIIALGRALPALPAREKVPANLVSGCLANVWLVGRYKAGCLFLQGDSDALVSKGLLALLCEVFSGQPLDEVMKVPLFFPKEIGLDRLISLQRRAGFEAVLGKIKLLAQRGLGLCGGEGVLTRGASDGGP
ncbi:MAG: SufE family protein [Bacteroidota bacterium]